MSTVATATRASRRPLFASGFAARMFARVWPALVFYPLAVPAGALRSTADDIGCPVRRSFSAIEDIVLSSAPTHWLQGSPVDTHPAQLVAATIYITWFLTPITTGFWVMLFRPRDYWRFIAFLLIVYYAVMPFFALYPLEPPWAHDEGIRRFLAEMFPEAAARDPNPYAAMPSLHVTLPAAAALWYGLRSWPGRLVFAYSLVIGLAVVYGGDHYVADVLAGYALAVGVLWIAKRARLPVFSTESSRPSIVVAPRPAERLTRAA